MPTIATLSNRAGHPNRADHAGHQNRTGRPDHAGHAGRAGWPADGHPPAAPAGPGATQPVPPEAPADLFVLLEQVARGLVEVVDALRAAARRLEAGPGRPVPAQRTATQPPVRLGTGYPAGRPTNGQPPATRPAGCLSAVPATGLRTGAGHSGRTSSPVPLAPVRVPQPGRRYPEGATIRVLPDERSVWRGTEEIRLSRLEFDLLLYFVEHPRRVFNRTQLLESVWGYTHAGRRTVDVHIRRLRAKLGEIAPLLTTVRGVGYRFNGGPDVAVVRQYTAA